MTTTTNTPTATPRIVSAARTRLDLSESSAMPTPSNRLKTRTPRSDMSGLLAHGGDRIEHRRATRGIDARDEADSGADADADEDRPDLNGRRQRRDRGECLGEADAEGDAQRGADGRQRRRFDQELVQNVAAARAERLPDSDLTRALGDGD